MSGAAPLYECTECGFARPERHPSGECQDCHNSNAEEYIRAVSFQSWRGAPCAKCGESYVVGGGWCAACETESEALTERFGDGAGFAKKSEP